MSRYSFESYVPETESQTSALAVARKVLDIARTDISQPLMVVFSGGPGVGKTHLIEAIRDGLSEDGIDHDYFSGRVPANKLKGNKVVIGDDAFSTVDKISGYMGSPSWPELHALNDRVLDDWYPDASLVVFSSNFPLGAIREALGKYDKIGRASSRLSEMSSRGVDVPITGADHRQSQAVLSLFE